MTVERNTLEHATPDTLAKMADDLATRAKELAAEKAALEAELVRRYPVPADFTGTEHRDDGDYAVKIEVPKKVDWNADGLIAACDALEAAGEDPREFVDFAPKVSETKFKSIPERFRKLLEPARTVTPGKAKITLVRKEP
jgi:hypothetical protein